MLAVARSRSWSAAFELQNGFPVLAKSLCLERANVAVAPEYLPRPTRSAQTCKNQKHTTVGIPASSPIAVLIYLSNAYVSQSGRDGQFSLRYGRMCRHLYLELSWRRLQTIATTRHLLICADREPHNFSGQRRDEVIFAV